MRKRVFLLLLMPLALFGCIGRTEKERPVSGPVGGEYSQDPELTAADDSADGAGIAAGLGRFNDFSYDFISSVLSDARANTALSPLSCGFALGLLLTGADGETAGTLGTVFTDTGAPAHEIAGLLKRASVFFTRLDNKVQVTFANSVWYSDAFRINGEFRKSAERDFDAHIRSLDFSDAASAGTINRWVEKKTAGRITGIIDSIEADQAAFLVNALYFKGDWTYGFDEKRTRPMDFFLDGGTAFEVPMMQAEDTAYGYHKADEAEILSLPYGNIDNDKGGADFLVFLPREGLNTETFMRGLTFEKMNSLIDGLAEVKYRLFMPKFVLESELLLNDALTDLGLGIIFSMDADFSPMLDTDVPLAVDYIKQKCFVEVNEKGTEAAAATAAAAKVTGVSKDPVVMVNRPFVFLIRERSTGIILFAGVVKRPAIHT